MQLLEKRPEVLSECELLQLLLSLAIPKRKTDLLVHELLSRFGSYGGVVSASTCRLREIPGISDDIIATLRLARASAIALQREEVIGRPVMNSWKVVLNYCRSAMAHEGSEQLRILFLDTKNVLIADEVQQTGTVNQVPLYPREVIKRALCLDATAIILVHNHPSNDPTPSREDIEMTREVAAAAEKLDIIVHDHVIIAKRGHASFRSMGLL